MELKLREVRVGEFFGDGAGNIYKMTHKGARCAHSHDYVHFSDSDEIVWLDAPAKRARERDNMMQELTKSMVDAGFTFFSSVPTVHPEQEFHVPCFEASVHSLFFGLAKKALIVQVRLIYLHQNEDIPVCYWEFDVVMRGMPYQRQAAVAVEKDLPRLVDADKIVRTLPEFQDNVSVQGFFAQRPLRWHDRGAPSIWRYFVQHLTQEQQPLPALTVQKRISKLVDQAEPYVASGSFSKLDVSGFAELKRFPTSIDHFWLQFNLRYLKTVVIKIDGLPDILTHPTRTQSTKTVVTQS